jgi:hypothetical protein
LAFALITKLLFCTLVGELTTVAMSDPKFTKVIVLVILSGLVAYRFLKNKRLGSSRHRLSFISSTKTASIQSLLHNSFKKRLVKPKQ